MDMGIIDEIRCQFPVLSRKVHGKDLVYFDNAATSQRPQSVIDEWNRITACSNANIHRAVHCLADEATQAYEASRDAVREFLNAEYREEIVFTSGTTQSVNLVAFCFGEAFVNEGDEVIVTEAEHHSNIVPWQMMCSRKGAVLKVLPVDESGHLMLEKLDELITDRTRILAVTQISNVLGIINPVKEIIDICHSKGVAVLVDGAQGVVHCKVDVQDLDCDFYAFSGHKMYAATGTGVLYGKKKWLDAMPPYMGGGEMVGTVSFAGTTYAPLPMKFEAGTQNFASTATLKPAIEFINTLNDNELINYNDKVRDYLLDVLTGDSRVRLFGVPRGTNDQKIPLFSFVVEGVHHEDLALILDKMGVAVRSGQMCAEPLMTRFGVTGMLRVSLAPYNTIEEAEYFVKCLNKAIDMLI
jgi:cysteine desulfurase/selenocysteine lyase